MKKIILFALLMLGSISAWAQFSPGTILTAAALNSQFGLYLPLTGGVLSGPLTATRVTDSALTANGFSYPSTGGLLASTSAATNGQVLIGSTGAAPVAATLTGTANQVSVTNGPGSIIVGLASPITSYNSNTLVAGGFPSIVADVTEPNLSNNLSSTTIYTIPSGKAGWYHIWCNAKLMTAAGTSSTLPSHTITGTDADNAGTISGNAGATSSGNTTSAWSQGILTMYLAAGSAINTTTTGYASNPANAMVYQARYLVFYDGP